ncbi:hypothetical protein [Bombilactobacillus thymidiniphilus]|uniref:Uncharacterized protein n=1 Tax=Bombilactobacillus thymidiniphilus TaxID=2923363 RepID=A0ABY4PBK8_9LACO|nr:hypothetical protein [Bombilactobacillus thymidiniphilus]UQS83066.1 hypothetical protein MOO47_04580 [Bombilactobacillus thymidiniphilus]
MSKEEHIIHVIGRVNLQYYLVQYCEHYYLVDYSSPKRVSNYGPFALINRDRELFMYNVDDDQELFLKKAKPLYLKRPIGNMLFILLSLSCFIFARILAGYHGVYDHHVIHPTMFLMVFLCGLIIIMLAFGIYDLLKIDVSKYPKYVLELTDTTSVCTTVRQEAEILIAHFLFMKGLAIGRFSNNIELTIIYGLVYTYFIIFSRFIIFKISDHHRTRGTNLYKLLSIEE